MLNAHCVHWYSIFFFLLFLLFNTFSTFWSIIHHNLIRMNKKSNRGKKTALKIRLERRNFRLPRICFLCTSYFWYFFSFWYIVSSALFVCDLNGCNMLACNFCVVLFFREYLCSLYLSNLYMCVHISNFFRYDSMFEVTEFNYNNYEQCEKMPRTTHIYIECIRMQYEIWKTERW